MKQFSIQILTLFCVIASSAAFSSGAPTGKSKAQAKAKYKPTYARESYQMGQNQSPQFGVYVSDAKGFGRRDRDISQEDMARALERAAQVNFQAPSAGYSLFQLKPAESASHHRSAMEVESRMRKMKKLRKGAGLPVEPEEIEVEKEEKTKDHASASLGHQGGDSSDQQEAIALPQPPSSPEIHAVETVTSAAEQEEPRDSNCFVDLEARFAPIKVFTLLNQLKRIKGQLMKNQSPTHTSSTTHEVHDKPSETVGGGDEKVVARDLGDDDVVLIRTFSEALDSLD